MLNSYRRFRLHTSAVTAEAPISRCYAKTFALRPQVFKFIKLVSQKFPSVISKIQKPG